MVESFARCWRTALFAQPQTLNYGEDRALFQFLGHTYGSRLAMRGVAMKVIAEQLGHKDTRVTERHYAHLTPSYVADTVRAAFGDLGLAPETAMVPGIANEAPLTDKDDLSAKSF